MSETVRRQYEAYPYPPRDPEDERHRLIVALGDSLPAIDYSVFGGRRNWSKPIRILVAGGGTGDSVIALGQQLAQNGFPGNIVYLDLSAASREIAEARAAVRGLRNIEFRTGSLLDLKPSDGPFDFINCSGVLHHLKEPAEGVRALASVLAPDGGMCLMVYGALGRAGVYPMQEMLKKIAPASAPSAVRVRTARLLIDMLPATNLLKLSRNMMGSRDDAEIFDLFLHSVDRAYLIDEFNDLLMQGGLRISRFVTPCLYNLANWCKNTDLLAKVIELDEIGRAAFTERFIGFIKKHEVFAVRTENLLAHPEPQPAAVPIWAAPFDDIKPAEPLNLTFALQAVQVSIALSDAESRIVRLIDSKRTIGEIAALSGLSGEEFSRAFVRAWDALNGAGAVMLRA